MDLNSILKECQLTKILQIEKLDLKSILKFGRDNTNIGRYLQEFKYTNSPNRDWLRNVINTVVYEEFKFFIKTAMKNRKTISY